MRPSHWGQPPASARQGWPAATHRTDRAADAAQTTMGSSALATTAPSSPGRARRHRAPSMRTSLTRSSWSRLRLSSVTTAGRVAEATWPSQASSTSRAAAEPGPDPRLADRAATRPDGRLAPPMFVHAGPALERAAASNWVVVVLPLVPLTRATRRPRARRASASGSRTSVTRPPMTVPLPAPSRRESEPTNPPTPEARRVRTGSWAVSPGVGALMQGRPRRGGRRAAWPEPPPRRWAAPPAWPRPAAGR